MVAKRAGEIQYYDLNADGRIEFYAPEWGSTGQFWVWSDGQYVNILTHRYEQLFYDRLETDLPTALLATMERWEADSH